MVVAQTLDAGGTLQQFAVPRAAARVLAACASASRLCVDLPLLDPIAERLLRALSVDRDTFDERELRSSAFRTLLVDWLTSDFFDRVPDAIGVGLWSILGTRGHRIKQPWVDVDAPDVADLRRQLLPERPGWVQLGACLCRGAWLEAICCKHNRRLLIVLDESVLPFHGEAMMLFLDDVSRRAPVGSELILAFDARCPLRAASACQRASALELPLHGPTGEPRIARYPRLRFVDEQSYPEELRTMAAGVNAISRSYGGGEAPAFAHLRLI